MTSLNYKTALIVQARTGSTRFPKKIIIPFSKDGRSILEIIIDRLKKYVSLPIIVATTTSEEDNHLVNMLKKLDVLYYRGPEQDVLKRFVSACERFGVERAVRICADNPFLNTQSINELLTHALNNSFDYVAFKIGEKPSIKTHFGFWAEYVTVAALKRAQFLTDDLIYKEHVTNFIYENPEHFNIDWLPGPSFLAGRDDIRLTIDTETDFTTAKMLYARLYGENQNPTIQSIYDYIITNASGTLPIMKNEILKNSK